MKKSRKPEHKLKLSLIREHLQPCPAIFVSSEWLKVVSDLGGAKKTKHIWSCGTSGTAVIWDMETALSFILCHAAV